MQKSQINQSQFINTQQIPQKNQVPADAVNMELRRRLWDGQLPIKVDLALSDTAHIDRPRSLYIMAPRENYFFYILNEVKSLFDPYVTDKKDSYDTMWFDFNNIPLKWNVPIGVQFDTIVGIKNKQKDLPWCLTFHYKDFPEEINIHLQGLNFLKYHYINSLKESHNLRMGQGSEILNIPRRDEERMILGITQHNFENFWEVNQPLCDKNVAELKKYAIRVFCNKHHTYLQPNIDVNSSDTEKNPLTVTIGDILMETFPRLFECVLNDNGDLEISKKRDFDVIIQGVEAEFNTPMYWMSLNLCYLDNFVYISLHFK